MTNLYGQRPSLKKKKRNKIKMQNKIKKILKMMIRKLF